MQRQHSIGDQPVSGKMGRVRIGKFLFLFSLSEPSAFKQRLIRKENNRELVVKFLVGLS